MRVHALYPRSRPSRTIATRSAVDIPNFTPFTSSGVPSIFARAEFEKPRRRAGRSENCNYPVTRFSLRPRRLPLDALKNPALKTSQSSGNLDHRRRTTTRAILILNCIRLPRRARQKKMNIQEFTDDSTNSSEDKSSKSPAKSTIVSAEIQCLNILGLTTLV